MIEQKISNDVVNTDIDWNLPVALKNNVQVNVTPKYNDCIEIYGSGFSCLITKSTGLPVSDVFNWALFPVKNIVK
jgi:hypothetical protein